MNTRASDDWLQGLLGHPVVVYHRDRQWQGLLAAWDDTVLLLSVDDKHEPNIMVQRGPGVCVRNADSDLMHRFTRPVKPTHMPSGGVPR